MSAEPDPLYIQKMQQRVREMKAELATQPVPSALPAQEPLPVTQAPKPKREPSSWNKAVKRYQELEKARGRSINMTTAAKELSDFKKSTA